MSDRFRTLTVPRSEIALAELHEAKTFGIEEHDDRLVAWFPEDADLEALCARLGGTIEVREEGDWSEKWREGIRPIRVGPIVVLPPWLLHEAGDGIRIVIDPARAFGTGDHPTTRGCLASLVRAVRDGDRILDFGCGTGILAIAARKLGAAHALAVDCDPTAIAHARANAGVNGVTLETAVAADPPEGERDIVVANIQSSVLFPLLPRLQALIAPGGTLVLSGLLAEEVIPLDGISARFLEGGWQTVAWTRPSS